MHEWGRREPSGGRGRSWAEVPVGAGIEGLLRREVEVEQGMKEN